MLDPQPNTPEPSQPAPSQPAPKRTNVVWRFYVDQNGAWRWQQLSIDQRVLSDSAGSHATFDDCVVDAEANGYTYTASQKKVGMPPRTNAHLKDWR